MANSVLHGVLTAAAESEHTSGIQYVIGGGILLFLLFALCVLVWFSGGREHS
ncbi:MAG: hypothetical protein J2O46_05365 [Nocardioides sp.]|nr:hypothetical protein [Nocardioides sp.]